MIIGRVISKSSSLDRKNRAANLTDIEQNEVESEIDINGWKIFAGMTITTLASAIITLSTMFFINIPNNNLERKFERSNMQFQLLAYALQSKDDTIRKNSLTLLINTGLVSDKDGKIEKMIKDGSIPDWSEYKNAILYRWSANSLKKVDQPSVENITSNRDATSNRGTTSGKNEVEDDNGDTGIVKPTQ